MRPLQWSPVLETGNTPHTSAPGTGPLDAAMEPGFRDREYSRLNLPLQTPQKAAMEPGFRDREYMQRYLAAVEAVDAAMEPGFRDREYLLPERVAERCSDCCNRARF